MRYAARCAHGGCSGACASAPPVAPTIASIAPEQKMSWILQLEDQRILRVPAPPPAVAPPPPPNQKKSRRPPPRRRPRPSSTPDLTALVGDPEPRIRRRAALAIGRVGLAEGSTPLQPRSRTPIPRCGRWPRSRWGCSPTRPPRPRSPPRWRTRVPRVRGRAAEALGLIGDAGSAAGRRPDGRGARDAAARSRAWRPTTRSGRPPEADAFRLGLFALVRLQAYEPLAAAVLDAAGQVSRRGGRSRTRCSGSTIRARCRRCRSCCADARQVHARVRGARARRDQGRQRSMPLLRACSSRRRRARGLVSTVRALGQIGDAARRGPPILAVLRPRAPIPTCASKR